MTDEPTIIAFCCHYCCVYGGGPCRHHAAAVYANVRIVRLPCTGKIDVNLVLKAFCEGADGVMVAGCEIGSCHFISGNLRARKRVDYAKQLLKEASVNPDRLEMFHIAASQGPRFAETAREFTEHIRALNDKEKKVEPTKVEHASHSVRESV